MRIVVNDTEYEVGAMQSIMVEMLCKASEIERSNEGSCAFNWHSRDVVFELRVTRERKQLPRYEERR